MNRNILSGLLWLLLPATLLAQPASKQKKAEKRAASRERVSKLIKQEEEGALIYQKQNLFGIKLYNDGYAVMFEKGILKTPARTTLFSVELGEHKHPKEAQVSSGQTSFIASNSFIYGKQNNFYFVKLGVGQSILIGGKGSRNGVAVSAVGNGGLAIGLLKPYYLNVNNISTKKELEVKYTGNSPNTDSLFLGYTSIINRKASLFKGFNELKIKPGVFAKAGLRFDYGRYNEAISAVEVGINAEYYFSKIPQIVLVKQRNLFLNLFIGIEFGKRK